MAERLIDLLPVPRFIVWDITYACPLRCTHCYAEAGRRLSRQLDEAALLRVADAMIAGRPQRIVIAGGEPLIVKSLFNVIQRFASAGVDVVVYTGGWNVDRAMANRLMTTSGICHIAVSIDGATAVVHDGIRGRRGSYARAVNALQLLDDAAVDEFSSGRIPPTLGVEWVVVKSNWHEMPIFCSDVLPRFAQVSSVSFGAVIPIGLASRPSFEALELLDDEQAAILASPEEAARLQILAPPSVVVRTSDNRRFQMHPDWLAEHCEVPPMQVEPDGQVRAMPVYEGVVGSLLEEPLSTLWERAIERWNDPFVTTALRAGSSMRDWAEAARSIDLHYGTPDDRARIANRQQLPRINPGCRNEV